MNSIFFLSYFLLVPFPLLFSSYQIHKLWTIDTARGSSSHIVCVRGPYRRHMCIWNSNACCHLLRIDISIPVQCSNILSI